MKDKICMNCSAFHMDRGNMKVPSNVQGTCRAGSAMPGGTRWAPVRGDEWCRDGFEKKKNAPEGS